MKEVMNLTKVPMEFEQRIKEDISRRVKKIERRLKRFSDEHVRLALLVQPTGSHTKRWETRMVLNLASHVIHIQTDTADQPEASLKEAFCELENRIQRHLERRRRVQRIRRKARVVKGVKTPEQQDTSFDSAIQAA